MNIGTNNLPETITLNLSAYVSDHGWVRTLDESDKSVADSYTEISSEPVEVTFKIKQRDEITGELVDRLREESQKVRADAEIKCQRIDEKINSLLALPEAV